MASGTGVLVAVVVSIVLVEDFYRDIRKYKEGKILLLLGMIKFY